ncbi:MAG: UDP-3-O-(3-hydroxymyristoyl)glucosamine N-acyltransferase [Azospirillaceae bacterium]
MADPRFFERHGPFALKEILAWSGGRLAGDAEADPEIPIHDVASIESAVAGCLSYVEGRRFADRIAGSAATAILVPPALELPNDSRALLIRCQQPKLAFAEIAQRFYPRRVLQGIHPTAVIEDGAVLGEGVSIGAHVTVGANAELGDRVQVGPSSVIGHGVVIGRDTAIGNGCSISCALLGERVRIDSGACIGESGFGWAMSRDGHKWVPQLGRVIIGNDVYIGANTTIDRGAGPDTVIGNGVLIDNLVQIGHNVTIGEGAILAGTVGLAGSVKIGAYALIGAGAGVADHVEVGDGAMISARAGVMDNVPAGERWVGAPAVPSRQFWRAQTMLKRLLTDKGKR